MSKKHPSQDFNGQREGEELLARAAKDKGAGPSEGSGTATHKTGSRSAGRRKGGQTPEKGSTEMASLTRERAARSPIQELKASVKKAAVAKTGKSKSRKPRRG